MICSKCGKRCKCVDSRDKLPYGGLLSRAGNTPIKERKYLCASCSKAFYTQEFLEAVRDVETKDKRVLGDI